MPTQETSMPKSAFLGEWEQLVLLTTLRLGDQASIVAMRHELNRLVGRHVSRGALYRTIDRLEEKGYLRWTLEAAPVERGGHPRRRFTLTRPGLAALKASRQALLHLWTGLEGVLD
jgi:PadR family transcriptional regulator